MKIYTKTGDAGETSLFGGGRVRKDHDRIETYGAVDELNATLGVARSECGRSRDAVDAAALQDLDATLGEIQHRLFDLGAELASPNPEADRSAWLKEDHVASLEAAIDRYEATLPPLREFVLPGGSPPAAQLHTARCVCRRAERLLVALASRESIRDLPLWYLNRLSDLLFVMARVANRAVGAGDTAWKKDG